MDSSKLTLRASKEGKTREAKWDLLNPPPQKKRLKNISVPKGCASMLNSNTGPCRAMRGNAGQCGAIRGNAEQKKRRKKFNTKHKNETADTTKKVIPRRLR